MSRSGFFKTLGPGILFASTAIGVSHLVQSTQAGADFGLGLVWAVILANLLKFPFFEFGSRYANVKGKSIIDGYAEEGRAILILYFLITLFSMWFVTAAVGAVTSGFLSNLLGISHLAKSQAMLIPGILLLGVFAMLFFGRFKLLDRLIKVIGITLLLSTIVAFVLTLIKGPANPQKLFQFPNLMQFSNLPYLIALMGWMPTAIDLSAWNSLWTIEKIKTSGYKPSLKETIAEFNFGYWVSASLSICFLTLGAYLLFGTSETLPEGSAGFAHGVVGLYTKSIGSWTYIIIASAAFSIMLGTCIGVFDGYARALKRSSELLFPKSIGLYSHVYQLSLFVIGAGAFLIIWQFGQSMRNLVDLAITISFIIAPVIALVNYRLVTKSNFPEAARPGKTLRLLSVLGILFLFSFSIAFALHRLGLSF